MPECIGGPVSLARPAKTTPCVPRVYAPAVSELCLNPGRWAVHPEYALKEFLKQTLGRGQLGQWVLFGFRFLSQVGSGLYRTVLG